MNRKPLTFKAALRELRLVAQGIDDMLSDDGDAQKWVERIRHAVDSLESEGMRPIYKVNL